MNRYGAGRLAAACAARAIPMIHLSTDYVFDGRKATPAARPAISVPHCSRIAAGLGIAPRRSAESLVSHIDTILYRIAR